MRLTTFLKLYRFHTLVLSGVLAVVMAKSVGAFAGVFVVPGLFDALYLLRLVRADVEPPQSELFTRPAWTKVPYRLVRAEWILSLSCVAIAFYAAATAKFQLLVPVALMLAVLLLGILLRCNHWAEHYDQNS